MPPMVEQEVVAFKNKLVRERKSGLVLDIDETLSWTVGYWVEQLQERFGNPENLTPREIIAKYRYTQLVPYWQSKEALEWMETARTNNTLQEALPLIEDANRIVQLIDQLVPIVGYLTIRPRSVVGGTRAWLKKHDFPQVDILARPAGLPTSEGNKWKADVLHFVYPQVLGIIDDNPAVVGHLPRDYQGTVYLYDSEEAIEGGIKVIPCKTWGDVHTQVRIIHGANG